MRKTTQPQDEHTPLRQQTFSVEEAGELLGISRSSAFQAAANGQLPVIKIGKRLLVPRLALEQMLGGPLNLNLAECSQ